MPLATSLPDFVGAVHSSDGRHTYRVRGMRGVLHCSCVGYINRGKCKHLDAIAALESAGHLIVKDGVLAIAVPKGD